MKSKKSILKSDIIFYLMLFAFIFISRRLYCFANVIGSSMNPTYKDGDYLFVSKVGSIKRGDTIVIDKKGYKDYLVKRVVAVSGDRVDLVDSKVFVNSQLLEEDYINTDETPKYLWQSSIVDNNSFFVLGDNRNHSSDSRVFGEVSSSEIIGVVRFNLTTIGITFMRVHIVELICILIVIVLMCKRKYKKDSK